MAGERPVEYFGGLVAALKQEWQEWVRKRPDVMTLAELNTSLPDYVFATINGVSVGFRLYRSPSGDTVRVTAAETFTPGAEVELTGYSSVPPRLQAQHYLMRLVEAATK
jgi:hypothetical protein